MKIYKNIEEYSKDNYNSKNLYIIKNEKIYFNSGNKIYESRNLFLIKNTHEKCKLCKYYLICENIINQLSDFDNLAFCCSSLSLASIP